MKFNFDSMEAVVGGGIGVVGSPRLPLDVIDTNPANPRSFVAFESDADWPLFVDSIRLNGILEPIYVTPPNASGRYLLIRGHRRLRGAAAAGLVQVPVRYAEAASEAKDVASLYLDNRHRKGLHPIDEARFFRRVMQEQGLIPAQLAEKFSLSATMVHERLTLLSLPEVLLDQLRAEKTFAARAAYELAVSYAAAPAAVAAAVRAGPVSLEKARGIRKSLPRGKSRRGPDEPSRDAGRSIETASPGQPQSAQQRALALVADALGALQVSVQDKQVAAEVGRILERLMA